MAHRDSIFNDRFRGPFIPRTGLPEIQVPIFLSCPPEVRTKLARKERYRKEAASIIPRCAGEKPRKTAKARCSRAYPEHVHSMTYL